MTTDTSNETSTAAGAHLAHGDTQAPREASGDAQAYEEAHGEDVIAQGVLSSEQILERTVLYALDQGVEMLEQNGGFEPFTVLISGEELYIEDQPGETEEESYESARRTLYQMERMCNAYVFCYDGYVDLEDGTSDAVVVEYASRDDKNAQIIVKIYHQHDEHYHFDETLYQVGDTETLFGDDARQGDAGKKEPEIPVEAAASEPDKSGVTIEVTTEAAAGVAEVAADVGKGVAAAAGEVTLDVIASAVTDLLP